MNKLMPLEFKNQRIIITKILAEEFGASEKNINDNFSNNHTRFMEGKHYFKLEGQALKDFKNSLPDNIGEPLKFAPKLILWTDRGVARHAKILDTDEAWEVYETLEENYFNPKQQKQLNSMEILELQFTALKETKQEVKNIKEDVKDIRENSPLYTIECKDLQALVKKVGTKALGGYKTPSYNDKSLRGQVYSDIQHQLKREFGVSRYEGIKRCQLSKAREIVQEYKAPTVLQDEIVRTNNQISF